MGVSAGLWKDRSSRPSFPTARVAHLAKLLVDQWLVADGIEKGEVAKENASKLWSWVIIVYNFCEIYIALCCFGKVGLHGEGTIAICNAGKHNKDFIIRWCWRVLERTRRAFVGGCESHLLCEFAIQWILLFFQLSLVIVTYFLMIGLIDSKLFLTLSSLLLPFSN